MSNILKTVTGPTELPTTLDAVKMHCRVTNTVENEYLTALIEAARDYAETFTRRTFVKTTYKMSFDCFSGSYFYLPRSPFIEIVSIKYLDSDLIEQTIDESVYGVDDADSIPSRVYLKQGQEWPSDIADQVSSISVTFATGYGDETTDVPKGIVAALHLIVGHWYENREEVIIGQAYKVPATVDRLLWSYRIYEDHVG